MQQKARRRSCEGIFAGALVSSRFFLFVHVHCTHALRPSCVPMELSFSLIIVGSGYHCLHGISIQE